MMRWSLGDQDVRDVESPDGERGSLVQYVAFRCVYERALLCGRRRRSSPVMIGIFATLPERTKCCGGAFKNTPSACGDQIDARPCITHIDTAGTHASTWRRITHSIVEQIG